MLDSIPRVGLLGGGQLGRMLVEEANRLNIPINVLDVGHSSAKQIHTHPDATHVDGSFSDADKVRQLAQGSDVLTVEIEHVDTAVLKDLATNGDLSTGSRRTIAVEPSWKTLETIQDKFLQKEFLKSHGIPIARAREVKGRAEVDEAVETYGYPVMLKARKQAYDGRGNYVIRSEADIDAGLAALGSVPGGLYVEEWVSFQMELAVMVVKTGDASLAYPTVELVSEDSVCKLVYAPARRISSAVSARAAALAQQTVELFSGRGVFGVEMFLQSDGESVVVNEIAPRPHNSGHYTIEACSNSQFAAQLRAVVGLPVPAESVKLIRPAVMLNVLSGASATSHHSLLSLALACPHATVHMYGKDAGRPGRKIGHITVTGSTLSEAEVEIGPLIEAADEIRAERVGEPVQSNRSTATTPSRPVVVGVITGSISDQPHMAACYALLDRFGIGYERGIKSAHRTPDLMAEYARTAHSRGIKVVIAAAGGAAHLPGMVAAFGPDLPVIGVPIKPTVGDGTDSLLSMTNMPRGVPVLTVGVNNSTNAALGAGRIIGMWDDRVRQALLEYSRDAADESTGNDVKIAADDVVRRGGA